MRAIGLALIIILLAGCSQAPVEATEARWVAANHWEGGEWWRFDTAVGQVNLTIIPDAGGWRVAGATTEDAELARIAELPFLGVFNNLHNQPEMSVRWFQWPLAVGQEWKTGPEDAWQGRVVAIEDGIGHVELLEDGTPIYSYQYDHNTGWWVDFRSHDELGRARDWFTLNATGQATPATQVHEWLWIHHEVPISGTSWGRSFDIPDGVDDAWLFVNVGCNTEGAAYVDFSNSDRQYRYPLSCPGQVNERIDIADGPDQWTVTYGSALAGLELMARGSYGADLYTWVTHTAD